MPTTPNPMVVSINATDQELAEVAITQFLDFLNAWHVANNEDFTITRADCNDYSDPPRLLGALSYNSFDTNRVLVIYCNPYHDEGGPSQLIAFFQLDQGQNTSQEFWVLRDLIQEFDTNRQFILQNGGKAGYPNGGKQ